MKTLEEILKKLGELGQTEVATALKALVDATAKTHTDALAAKDKTIAEKDVLITQKNDDLVNLRKSSAKEYKALKDMTDAERGALSEKEKELLERAEAQEAEMAQFRKEQAEALQKEVDSRKGKAFERLVGTKDPELRKKVEEAYKKIVDSDKAQTEEEVTAIATQAFNMLGVPKPEGVGDVIQRSGDGGSGGATDGSFAGSADGQKLAEGLNLTQVTPEAKKAVEDTGGGAPAA